MHRPFARCPLPLLAALPLLGAACTVELEGYAAAGADAGTTDEEREAFPGETGELREDRFYTAEGPETLAYEVFDDVRVFEGDILLPDPVVEKMPGSVAPSSESDVLATIGRRWKDGVVPYVIPEDFPKKQRIRWAMDHIEAHSDVRFVSRSDEKDFVRFRQAKGCASYVGRRGGPQPISLSARCSRATVVHELLHALGVFHEQSRSIRDRHVVVRWDNIRDGKQHNFRKVSKARSTAYSWYDLDSIMHYSSFAFSKDGKPTLVKKGESGPDRLIRFKQELSPRDIRALNRMY